MTKSTGEPVTEKTVIKVNSTAATKRRPRVYSLFRVQFRAGSSAELLVMFNISDSALGQGKRTIVLPFSAEVPLEQLEFVPPMLDFGIVDASSAIPHQVELRARNYGADAVELGIPFVPTEEKRLHFNFNELVEHEGRIAPRRDSGEDSQSVGSITFASREEGEVSGFVYFCA